MKKPTYKELTSALKLTIWQRDELVKEKDRLYKIIEALVKAAAKGI